MDNGYSLGDLAAVSGNGFGGSSAWVLIILFALIFGWGGTGFGNRSGEFGQYATAASQNEILFGQRFSDLGSKINSIGDGLCSSTYALNNTILGAQNALGGSINDVRYDLATQNASTQAAIHAEGEATRAAIAQNKIEALQAKVSELSNQLALNNATCNVPKINPYMYGIVPTCGCNCNI